MTDVFTLLYFNTLFECKELEAGDAQLTLLSSTISAAISIDFSTELEF